MELQPVLEGALVRLRPLRPADFDELYAVAADPLIWAQHPASDRHEPAVFRDFFQVALDSGGAFAVVDTADGRMIGSTRYHGYDAARREVEIGWTFLARSHWGGRYNGEMKRLMLDHAFGDVDRVIFLIGPGNVRSRRAIEKIGAVEAGTRSDGAGRESIVYEVTRGMYRAARRGAAPTPIRGPSVMHGKICYIEVPAADVQASADFYTRVFGWPMRRRGDGETAFDDAGGAVSGALLPPGSQGASPGMVTYIMVDSIAQAERDIAAAGGRVTTPRTPIGGGGAYAVFTDPAGNRLGLYEETRA